MAGLGPAINVFIGKVVDARPKPGHDGARDGIGLRNLRKMRHHRRVIS